MNERTEKNYQNGHEGGIVLHLVRIGVPPPAMVSTVGGAQCREHLASAVQEELKFTLIAEMKVGFAGKWVTVCSI